jgi:hypothetical protein
MLLKELEKEDSSVHQEGTHKAYLLPGNWRAGSHGWWVYLEPLTPGEWNNIVNSI